MVYQSHFGVYALILDRDRDCVLLIRKGLGCYTGLYDLPGGGCLAITNLTGEQPSAAAGGTIAFEVEDLDALIADLKSQNVAFKSDIIESPVCRMSICVDSEGNSILLHQLKPKAA